MRIAICFCALAAATPVSGQKMYESDYIRIIHAVVGGEMEKRVDNGRIDILTDTHAYEVERADKWKHAIGQSLWYALQENVKAAIVLIMEEQEDYSHYIRLNTTLDYAGLADKIDVTLYPRDYE